MLHNGLSPAVADREAWDALRHWPAHTRLAEPWRRGTRLLWRGLDAEPIVRSLLWDKVGRAARAALDPRRDQFERELLQRRYADREPAWTDAEARIEADAAHHHAAPAPPQHAPPRHAASHAPRPSRDRALVYLGVPSRITLPYVQALASDARFSLLAPPVDEPGFDAVDRAPWPKGVPDPDAAFVAALHDAILDGLTHQNLNLLPEDARELRAELWREDRRTARAGMELDHARPDLILLHADNHPPFVQYALAARARGIPAVLVQHGLDCERWFLDDAFASHLLVWSPNRADRYRRDSRPRPRHVHVIGHPSGAMPDHLPPPAPGEPGLLLWVTRPHDTHKCLLPSRHPDEGLAIFDALVAALRPRTAARLLIKPHPADYRWLYEARRDALEPPTRERVALTTDPLEAILPRAAAVVTEDSTAGLDALLAGRPLVHAHLCTTDPVIPFARDRAALPGFTPAELTASAGELLDRDARGEPAWVGGERMFIERFAGPTDGRAIHRAIELMARIARPTRFSRSIRPARFSSVAHPGERPR